MAIFLERKENHIGSAVSEILRYRQTSILLLLYKKLFMDVVIRVINVYILPTFIKKKAIALEIMLFYRLDSL